MTLINFTAEEPFYPELKEFLKLVVKSMEWEVYFRKYKLYTKMSLIKVALLIILHFLVYSLLRSDRIVDSIFRTGVEIS
jgi:hypothetical protein